MVFMLADREEREGSLQYFADERKLLAAFVEWFQRFDPDLLIGWNVVGFDLNFLAKKCDELKIDLALGRGRQRLRLMTGNRRSARAQVPGRAVMDGIWALKGAFYNFEDFRLDTVARELLGEGKLISGEHDKIKEIERLFKHDKRALAEYNLQDAVLVTEIFRKTELVEHYVRRSQISGMLLDQVGASAASLDHFYIPRLHQCGYVAPDIDGEHDIEPAAGGFVFDPEAGIHEQVIVLDYQSLYPSIIRTFKIDPLSRLCSDVDTLETPVGIRFSRTRHLLPDFIADLLAKRDAARQSKQPHLSQAIKILMNSFYGVMGSSLSRFYHPDLPAAITGTGQWILRSSKEHIEESGCKVIYGDTDSLFVKLPPGEAQNASSIGMRLASGLNDWWREKLKQDFQLESFLHAKFEKLYDKLLLPAARGHGGGAKKRYAGLLRSQDGQHLDFVGMEVVRSDWTRLAKDFQIELYGRIFRGEAIDAWIRELVSEIKAGKHDDKLIYRRRLLKDVGEYTKSVPPFVRAAMLLDKPGRDIAYYMTLRGPIPIQHNPRDLDYAHYIAKQLEPIADSILCFVGKKFDEILKGRSQLTLFS
jgi:DNA polymerase-2